MAVKDLVREESACRTLSDSTYSSPKAMNSQEVRTISTASGRGNRSSGVIPFVCCLACFAGDADQREPRDP